MDILKVLWVFFPLFLVICAKHHNCPASDCGNKSFTIRFPYKLEGQPQNCGYPGFDLRCNRQGKSILSVPYSGTFFVRDINYLTKRLQLYDPNNCLPSRLLNLNLSSSPFTATYFKNYTFLSCPPDLIRSNFTAIDCLSNSTTSILATSSITLAKAMNMCAILATLRIPISWPHQYDGGFSSVLNGDLLLSWELPSCEDCEAKGGICGFANSTTREISCFDAPGTAGNSRGLEIFRIIALSFVIPAIPCLCLGISCFICMAARRARSRGRNNNAAQISATATISPQSTTVVTGLDDSTIETYGKVVLGESLRLPGFNDVTCPICLTDYSPNEAIRSIPDCKHCFHAGCIDEWLRMNGSCPLCRNSPTSSATHNS